MDTNYDLTNEQRRGFPPSLFIIGSQKSGTTFLADMLNQHQEILLADPKEPGFFARNFEKGEDWYRKCFSYDNGTKILLDASTSYTMSPDMTREFKESPLVGVPERICNFSPDAKLIYVMRNPVMRTYSAYWHNVRAGTETRGFIEAIKSSDFYLRTSNYMLQINEFKKYFNDGRIKLLIFEEMIENPASAIEEVCEFIGIDSEIEIKTAPKNRSFVYKGWMKALNEKMASKGGINPLLKFFARMFPHSVKNLIRDKMTEKIPKISTQEYQAVFELLQPSTVALEEYMGRKINFWK
ncbi:MAG: sulfotransferase [Sedimenticola sp.]